MSLSSFILSIFLIMELDILRSRFVVDVSTLSGTPSRFSSHPFIYPSLVPFPPSPTVVELSSPSGQVYLTTPPLPPPYHPIPPPPFVQTDLACWLLTSCFEGQAARLVWFPTPPPHCTCLVPLSLLTPRVVHRILKMRI